MLWYFLIAVILFNIDAVFCYQLGIKFKKLPALIMAVLWPITQWIIFLAIIFENENIFSRQGDEYESN